MTIKRSRKINQYIPYGEIFLTFKKEKKNIIKFEYFTTLREQKEENV